jgi:hypothetical protein
MSSLAVLAAIKVRDDRRVSDIWSTLEARSAENGVFTEDLMFDLPDPARRYFLHAIQPGTPLASRLTWTYSGSMKSGPQLPWMALQARQILVKNRGFIWLAGARLGPLFVTATDHYLDGDGRMRIVLFGLIPLINATCPDLAKSAMARLLIEGVALPTTLLPGPHCEIEPVDEARFVARVYLHGETTPITVTADPDGRPLEMVLPRWGNMTDDGTFQYIPYGVTLREERSFGGYTIPTRVPWWIVVRRQAVHGGGSYHGGLGCNRLTRQQHGASLDGPSKPPRTAFRMPLVRNRGC